MEKHSTSGYANEVDRRTTEILSKIIKDKGIID